MKTLHISILSISIGMVVGAALTTVILLGLLRPTGPVKSSAERRRDMYCAAMKAELLQDARELETPASREWAADSLGAKPGHSYEEIAMCAEHAPDAHDLITCKPVRDYECLAKFARAAADSIAP